MTGEVTEPSGWRAALGPALEILALWALAGAEPVLELFGKNAEFFLASGAGPIEITAFAGVVAFAVPVVLIGLEALVRLVLPSAAPRLHRGILGLLGAVLGLNVARQFGLDAFFLALAVAAAFAALVLWLHRQEAARTAMHYLGVAPLAFVLLFLFASEAGALVFSEDADVVDLDRGSGGPVAVVVLDELPLASLLTTDGLINASRFPNFARLAGTATWYRNATSVNPSTPESVPSILTGQYPEEGRLPTSADRPINIFTLLGGAYDVDAFEGVTDLCPDVVCVPTDDHPGLGPFFTDVAGLLGDAGVVYGHLTLPPPLRDGLPTLDQSWAGFLDEPSTVDAADELTDFLVGRASGAVGRGGQGLDLVSLIEGFDAAPGSLLVGHDPFLPHRPWHLTPSGAAYDARAGGVTPGMEEWPDSPAFVRRVLQRHLLQVGFADALLGRLLDRFEAAGTLDSATIVVVADHGMAFEAGGRARDPGATNVQEIYRVPLFIKAPGQTPGDGRVSGRNALLVDVLPTVMDLLGIEPPADAEFDGQSLVDPGFDREADDKPVFYGAGPQTVPGDFADLQAVALRNAGYVGDGGWVELLQVGPAGRLVNRRVADVPRSRPLVGAWEIDQGDQLEEITDPAQLPIAVTGRIEVGDDVHLPNQVLIAVDGILAGIGDLDRDDGQFAALLDERRLTVGPHEVDLYLPTERGGVQRIVEG